MCVHVEFRSAFDFVSVLITFAALGDLHTCMYFLQLLKGLKYFCLFKYSFLRLPLRLQLSVAPTSLNY